MDSWLSYRPEDFLLFSEPVYWRLFELHNAALWPAQIPALIAGLALAVLLIRPTPWAGRAIATILALAWATSALTFLPRYATINWLAADLVPVLLLQAGLLALVGVLGDGLRPTSNRGVRWAAVGLCVYALVLHPFIATLAGRPFSGAEIFALAPDPTALVSLAAVLAAGSRPAIWFTMPVPLLWCLVSAATLMTLGTWEAAAPLGAIVVVLAAGLPSALRSRQ